MLANSFSNKSLNLHCGSKFRSKFFTVMDEDSKKCMVGQINKLLSKSSSRMDGIQLLNKCLSQFSPEIICEQGPMWISTCLNHHEKEKNIEVYLKTLTNILYAQNSPDFNKKFVSDFLTPTLDMALKISGDINVKEASLNCLTSCLVNYAASCNFFKTRIEEYTLRYLDTSSDKLNLASGLVFFYCQQIGNAGSDGNNFVNNITLAIRRLCVTCHRIFDSILEDHIEYEKYESNDIQPLNIKPAPIHYSDYMKQDHEVQSLKNSLNWIMILLRKSSTKIIYPQEILSVIQRGVSTHSCLEQDLSNFESTHFAFHFITIQMEVLRLLGIFIREMGVLLNPFYHRISKIILDMIIRSYSCSCYFTNSLIQDYLYDVFTVWLRMGGTELDQSMQDKLVTFIIKHVFLNASGVSLKLDQNLIEKSLKIMKTSQRNNVITKGTSDSSLAADSMDYNSMTHFSALNTLHILFNYTHLSLSESILNKLYSFLLTSILSVQNGQAKFPFNDEKCQLILYKIICSIFEQNFVKILPPLPIIINILHKGCENENEKITVTCLRGLKSLEKICQPVCKSLYTIANKKNWSKDDSLQKYVVNTIPIVKNSLDSSIQINDEISTVTRSLDVKVLYNEVIVPPAQKLSGLDTEDSQTDELEEKMLETEEKFNAINVKCTSLAKTSTEDNVKPNKKNNEEFQHDSVSKKRKVEQSSGKDILNCFVDLVNYDYE